MKSHTMCVAMTKSSSPPTSYPQKDQNWEGRQTQKEGQADRQTDKHDAMGTNLPHLGCRAQQAWSIGAHHS